MKVKIRNITMMLWTCFFLAMQQVHASVASIDEAKVNVALGEFQGAIGGVIQILSMFGILTAILALVLLLIRLAMYSNNPMIRQMVLRNIGGTLVAVGILGAWNLIVYLVLTSTIFS